MVGVFHAIKEDVLKKDNVNFLKSNRSLVSVKKIRPHYVLTLNGYQIKGEEALVRGIDTKKYLSVVLGDDVNIDDIWELDMGENNELIFYRKVGVFDRETGINKIYPVERSR